MKKSLRKISMLIAVFMLLGALLSCADTPDKGGRGEYEGYGDWDGTRATTPDLLPDDLDYDGATISVIYRNGIEKYEATGDFESADIVYQAVYERNAAVEARLNIEFEWVPTMSGGLSETKKEIVNLLSTFVDDYDYILSTNNTVLSTGMNSYLWDFNTAMYVDLSQPWWWMDCIEEMAFDGKTYNYLVGEMNLINFTKMSAFYFNSRLLKTQLGLEPSDMYDKVDSGTWTLDELNRLVSKCFREMNGDNTPSKGDLFGLPIAGAETVNQLLFSTDFDIYERKPNGRIEITLNNNRLINACDKLTKLMHENNGVYIQKSENGSSGFDSFVITDFTEGKYVFMAQRFTAVCSDDMREMEDAYGILPYPTLEEGDEYVSYIQSSSTCVSCPYAIDEERFERTCAVLEALAAEAYRNVTETFYEYALKAKYVRDDYDSPRMIDIIYNTSTKYFLDEYNGEASGIMSVMYAAIANKTSVATKLAEIETAAEISINEFIIECMSAYK